MKELIFKDTLPIEIEITVTENGTYIACVIDDRYEQFKHTIVEGNSIEDVKKKLTIMLGGMLHYYHKVSIKYYQRAIFRYNKHTSQFWFTIIGFGLIFYLRPKEMKIKFPKLKPKYQFHIGRLYISFKNEWKRKAK